MDSTPARPQATPPRRTSKSHLFKSLEPKTETSIKKRAINGGSMVISFRSDENGRKDAGGRPHGTHLLLDPPETWMNSHIHPCGATLTP